MVTLTLIDLVLCKQRQVYPWDMWPGSLANNELTPVRDPVSKGKVEILEEQYLWLTSTTYMERS